MDDGVDTWSAGISNFNQWTLNKNQSWHAMSKGEAQFTMI